jgi:hypothetical protein
MHGDAPVRRSLPENMNLTMFLSRFIASHNQGGQAVWKQIKLYPDPSSREPEALHPGADTVRPGRWVPTIVGIALRAVL